MTDVGEIARLSMAFVTAGTRNDDAAISDLLASLDARTTRSVLVGVVGVVGGVLQGLGPEMADLILSRMGIACAEMP